MPHLLLIRHGNTFESDETPTYVGGRTDLKLTTAGEQQGEAVAAMIAAHYRPLGALVCGPLIRTRRFAEMIEAKTGMGFTIDDRLKEVDYGLWENKTTEQVKTLYGESCVEEWEKNGTWPTTMQWSPTEDTLIGNVRSLLDEQHNLLRQAGAKNSAIVTSNGILRFVYRLLTGNKADSKAKVKTGAYCVLSPTTEGWAIDSWNERPA